MKPTARSTRGEGKEGPLGNGNYFFRTDSKLLVVIISPDPQFSVCDGERGVVVGVDREEMFWGSREGKESRLNSDVNQLRIEAQLAERIFAPRADFVILGEGQLVRVPSGKAEERNLSGDLVDDASVFIEAPALECPVQH
jgi:hypothetical protein